jgi:hypothetical protein
LDSASLDFGGDIAVAEQHRGDLTRYYNVAQYWRIVPPWTTYLK